MINSLLDELSPVRKRDTSLAQELNEAMSRERAEKMALFRKKFLNGVKKQQEMRIKNVLEDDEVENLLFQRYLRELNESTSKSESMNEFFHLCPS